jgi:murein DD-endopeptidase MepM/ murein hydrolase activator NlpD
VLALGAGAAVGVPAALVLRGDEGRAAQGEVLVAGEAAPAATGAGTTPATTAAAARAATATASPTPVPTPVALELELVPGAAVGIGETLRVGARAAGATAATLELRGAAYRAVVGGDGTIWAVVGVPLDDLPAEHELVLRVLGAGSRALGSGAARFAVVPVQRPVDYLQLTPDQASVLTPEAAARESALRAAQFSAFDAAPRWSGTFVQPTTGSFTTRFGQGRSINGGPVGGFHTGLDIGAAEGTPVVAAADGRVAWVGAMPIRGNSVLLDHGGGVKSGYHHLAATHVAEGEFVALGTPIGAVGATGLVTGPHLHWEVTLWGVNVEPLTWTSVAFGPV